MPSAEEEVWRYSRIADLDLARYAPSTEALSVSVELPASWADAGATLERGPAASADAAGDPDVFVTLNRDHAADQVTVRVPRGAQLAEPLEVGVHVAGEALAAFPRLVVEVGEGASATVLERTTSTDDDLLTVPRTELRVARGGRLAFATVQDLGARAWQIGSLVAEVAQEGNLEVSLVGLGGEYARMRTDCILAGRGANGDLSAAYFGDGDQTLDFRTFQEHAAPDTTSNLLFKGAVGGRSRSVYTGLIRVDKDARGTSAFQTNRNVKLSDEAWAESVPNLEIETNDVRCSHASTVGPVDPEQRFYLESRGVPPTVADRLIVAGFFDEVVRGLPTDALVADVRARIAAKLDQVAEDLR
ncbi:MAG: Fe-S cluster assembly protein SufD [Acidimicrobiales bacterium]